MNMGLTRDNFQLEGKDASLTLFLKIGNRLWITESPIKERSLGDTWSGPVAFLGLAAFINLFFTNSQLTSMLSLVGVTLVIKVFKDDKSKGSR